MANVPQPMSVTSTSRSPPPSGSSARGHGSRQPGLRVYGPFTDMCARALGYGPSVCEDLLGVQEDYGPDQWLAAILRVIPECTEANAHKFKQAMLQDRDLQ